MNTGDWDSKDSNTEADPHGVAEGVLVEDHLLIWVITDAETGLKTRAGEETRNGVAGVAMVPRTMMIKEEWVTWAAGDGSRVKVGTEGVIMEEAR